MLPVDILLIFLSSHTSFAACQYYALPQFISLFLRRGLSTVSDKLKPSIPWLFHRIAHYSLHSLSIDLTMRTFWTRGEKHDILALEIKPLVFVGVETTRKVVKDKNLTEAGKM